MNEESSKRGKEEKTEEKRFVVGPGLTRGRNLGNPSK